MLEGYMQPNNEAQVVKRCVPKCPVFINTTAEVVRCCPKNGCNEALDHRPRVEVPPPNKLPPGRDGNANNMFPPGFDPRGGHGPRGGHDPRGGLDPRGGHDPRGMDPRGKMPEPGKQDPNMMNPEMRPDMMNPEMRPGMKGGDMMPPPPGLGAGGVPKDPRMMQNPDMMPPSKGGDKKMPMHKDHMSKGGKSMMAEKGSSKRDMKDPRSNLGGQRKARPAKAGRSDGYGSSSASVMNISVLAIVTSWLLRVFV